MRPTIAVAVPIQGLPQAQWVYSFLFSCIFHCLTVMQPHLSTLHLHSLLCVKDPYLNCYVFLGHIVFTDSMNLESKELPESFLVQVIWEWLTIRCQTMLSPHPHTSVTSLCAETMQSGWWVLSVISWWKVFLKRHAHEGSNGAVEALFPLQSLQNSGAVRIVTFSLPLLFYFCLCCPVSCSGMFKLSSRLVMTKRQALLSLWRIKSRIIKHCLHAKQHNRS